MIETLAVPGAEEAEHEESAASEVLEFSSSFFQKLIIPGLVPLGSQGNRYFCPEFFPALWLCVRTCVWEM